MNGIAILGLNGVGKSTIAHALAKETGFYELDIEDCYFPEQSESRLWALDNDSIITTNHLGLLPFSCPRSKVEVEDMITSKIDQNPKFILSGVTMNWASNIMTKIGIVFIIDTPTKERLNRIQTREKKRFGARVLTGGDMFYQQIEFLKIVADKDTESVKKHISKLDCPVIMIDGTLSIEQNIGIIKKHLEIYMIS